MAVQQGRNKRGAEAYPLRYVEGPSEARTPLAVIFNILVVMARHYTDVVLSTQ